MARKTPVPEPAAPVAAPAVEGQVRITFMSLDEREIHGVRDVPAEERAFRMAHNNTLYEQGRLDGDGSWIYHDRGL